MSNETPGNITSPVESTSGRMTAEDDLKFLRQDSGESKDEIKDEDKNEDIEEDEDDRADSKDDESRDEDKDEDESEVEDEEEETEPVGSLVTAKDLKEKYPDIFKKVPELRNVIYREQQYSQIFSDPKEAQLSSQKSAIYDELDSELASGNIKVLFSALKQGEGFDKVIANLLPALKEVDETAFNKLAVIPIKQALRHALAQGIRTKNKNLEYAAQHLHQYIFDNLNFDSKEELEQEAPKTNAEEEKYKKKLEELDARDHSNFKTAVDSAWLKEVETAFFDRLDPDNSLTQWTKNKMFEDAVKELNTQLVADSRYMKAMEGLWRNAKASGYSSESKSRIVATALARAKQIIPQVRQKLRSEISGKGQKNEKKAFKVVKKEGRQPEKPSTRDTSKMSDLDIIRSA